MPEAGNVKEMVFTALTVCKGAGCPELTDGVEDGVTVVKGRVTMPDAGVVARVTVATAAGNETGDGKVVTGVARILARVEVGAAKYNEEGDGVCVLEVALARVGIVDAEEETGNTVEREKTASRKISTAARPMAAPVRQDTPPGRTNDCRSCDKDIAV